MFDEAGNARVPHAVLQHMFERSGGFMNRLAALYLNSDQTNRNRVVRCFLPEFEEAGAATPPQSKHIRS